MDDPQKMFSTKHMRRKDWKKIQEDRSKGQMDIRQKALPVQLTAKNKEWKDRMAKEDRGKDRDKDNEIK